MAQGGGGGRTPDTAEDGVYIQDIDGFLYTVDEWDLPNEKANGVAVISRSHPKIGFVFSKETSQEKLKVWGSESMIVSGGCTSTTIRESAIQDFNGQHNTDQIINYDSKGEAARYCKDYIFPNGKNGYLGGCGEWYIARNNRTDIDKCMSKIGGFPISNRQYHWTSTQYNRNQAWEMAWDSEYSTSMAYKSGEIYTRPFSEL